jgi:hypothetical protein
MNNTPPSPLSPILEREIISRARTRQPNSIGPAQNGTRKISLQLLSPPSSVSSRSLSTSSDTAFAPDTRHILVPEILESALSYEFIGFCKDTAVALYQQWMNIKPSTKLDIDFVGFAKKHVESNTQTILDQDDNWMSAMEQLGIRSGIRDALMKAKHSQIRGTMVLSEWLYIILDVNFGTLENLNETIQTHLDTGVQEPNMRGGHEEVDEHPSIPDNHIALYKTLPFQAFKECFNEDGTIHLGKLESKNPTDFCRKLNDICVSPDVRTLEIHVPLEYVQSLKVWRLEFDDRWKELIWCSRRAEYYPTEWDKEHCRQELIIGPIAHGANKHYSRMKDWKKIGPNNIIMSPDGTEMSSQYVFMKERNLQALETQIVGKSYLIKTYGDFKVIAHPWIDKSVNE